MGFQRPLFQPTKPPKCPSQQQVFRQVLGTAPTSPHAPLGWTPIYKLRKGRSLGDKPPAPPRPRPQWSPDLPEFCDLKLCPHPRPHPPISLKPHPPPSLLRGFFFFFFSKLVLLSSSKSSYSLLVSQTKMLPEKPGGRADTLYFLLSQVLRTESIRKEMRINAIYIRKVEWVLLYES